MLESEDIAVLLHSVYIFFIKIMVDVQCCAISAVQQSDLVTHIDTRIFTSSPIVFCPKGWDALPRAVE